MFNQMHSFIQMLSQAPKSLASIAIFHFPAVRSQSRLTLCLLFLKAG